MPLPLAPALSLLLLLLLQVSGGLSREGGLAGPNGAMPDVAEREPASLPAFLAWWHRQGPRADAGPSWQTAKRQDSLPPQPPPRPAKPLCRNFFWKTFSSCK
ncbi:cortistatin [Sorex araneus]|uniref:cortistatin n=1 Tax=Sorex araneus TaxID=42254 RepID=UPI0024334374|nr:cortistatin [Sorex araneus]